MKKIYAWASAAFAVATLLAGCQQNRSGENQTAESVVQTYTIEQFMNTTSITGNDFAPDNSKILYSSNQTGVFNAFEVPVAGGEPRQLTTSTDNSVYSISYFPKDERILYSSDKGGDEITHLFVRNTDGTTKDLTPEPKAKATFAGWSHDQNSFFFLSNKRDPRYFDLYEMDLQTMTPKLVMQNEQGFDVVSISRDKKHIGLLKSINTNSNDMYLYNTDTKQLKKLTNHTEDVKYSPETFTPDNKKLYFLTNEGGEFMELNSYDLSTGNIADVEKANWDISNTYFSRDGKYRVTSINNDARIEIKVYEAATGKQVQLPNVPTGDITGVNFSDDENLMAFYVNSPTSSSNLFVHDFRNEKTTQLTNTMNPEINPDDLVKTEVIRYKSYDGLEIPALLMKPKNASADNKVPAVLWIHGGPGGQTRLNYSPLMQYLVNHGYAVLAVNNRGSSGYGKTFFAADDLKHGDVDLKDCIAAKEYLAATGYVDADKIGIMGGSYGGYMVLAGLAFTPDEFAVGVNLFGVANWLRTLQSIPPYWESFREALYKELGNPETDSAALYNKSPLFFAHQIKKPLMVLQGANDPRVLKVESDEIVEAVKKNNVPVEYVVFDDEGHGFVKKENQIEGYSAILAFLNEHLKGDEANPASTDTE
ncbi:S9 family peptidase [Pontibacter akesuensis]|uniref:Acyl-peptide hydrolase n=1 Tax=Pontibacter akesuensis TaxID=388950 RepID=A0A1I7K7G8_9BACT|nr:S9 family peptidase [Pontibacter akesuensis]GHA74521.1 peptidase S9 [Pontibacter akesuensis]SFU93369.1 Dipeptidyl aminopeptidase/acylaminoacyl peptidase [Pontibacter akesuensis]